MVPAPSTLQLPGLPCSHRPTAGLLRQGFTCPADSGQVCGNTPNPAGSNLDYGYQGFDNFAMLALVVFQVSRPWQDAVRGFAGAIHAGSKLTRWHMKPEN